MRNGRWVQYGHNFNIKKRGLYMLIFFFTVAVLLVTVLFKMQFFDYEAYQKKVIDQITVGSALKADRGLLYDINGSVLATNKTVWRVFISPVDIKTDKRKTGNDKSELIAKGLSEILGVDYHSLYDKTQKGSTLDQTVKKGIDEDSKARVLEFISQNSLEDMVHIEAESTRYYPYGTLASHVIGFTGSDNQGLFGIESSMNEYLTGTDGRYIYTKDAKGNELPLEYISYEEAVDGASITTTIDIYIQRILEENVALAMSETGATNRVCAAIMDVNTGGILGMATAPSYNLNTPFVLDSASQAVLDGSGYAAGSPEYSSLKSTLLYTMWNNKVISEIYEPGSTFKVITACVGIDSGSITENDRFDCIGYYKIGGYRISCHKKTGHGSGITFATGLQQSCNPTMMQTVARIGAKTFYEYYTKFGYTEKSGIDLPSEAKGIFHTYEGLGTTELATASFGQRFKVSPIAHLRAIAAAANGGYLVTPHLVDRVVSADGNTVYKHDASQKEQIISSKTSEIVSRILEEGVSGDGGARNAGVLGYKVAAKTGTSQKFDDATGNDTGERIGSCIAYAPSDDAKIAVIFIVDQPQTFSKYGSVVAAPYISRILSDVLPYLGYEPSYAEGTQAPTVTVKDYIGKDASEAVKEILADGLICYVNGKQCKDYSSVYGTVRAQTPVATSEIQLSPAAIYLYTDDYNIYKTLIVPSVIGKPLSEANKILTDLGLNIKITGLAPSSGNITVGAQSIAEGSEVMAGTFITLTPLYKDSED